MIQIDSNIIEIFRNDGNVTSYNKLENKLLSINDKGEIIEITRP